MQKGDFANFNELQAVWPHADLVRAAGNTPVIIFDIGGSKYRLVVNINWTYKGVYIKRIMTHAELRRLEQGRKTRMIAERALNAWQGVTDAGIKRPITEADYEELHGLMDELTSRQDINEQPWSDLFGLIATYMHEWELVNEPDLKNPQVAPHEMLAYLMEQRGVTQYRLAKDGVVSQGTLNAILKGRRGISKAVAKKLAAYFGVSVELFI